MKTILAVILTSLFSVQFALALDDEAVNFGNFGKIAMYSPSGTPSCLVLFVSGDGGWQHGVINMARNLTMHGALVAGIDAKVYSRALTSSHSRCLYPAADFERLSLFLQKKYKFNNYTKPILAGYSYGATLIYALLAQAPAGTFKGAIALGFCPDIQISKAFCDGNGLSSHLLADRKTYYLERTNKLSAPFIALAGVKDKSCPFTATQTFLKDLPFAEFVALPKVGHGFSIADNWLPQFNTALRKVLESRSDIEIKNEKARLAELNTETAHSSNLPLVHIPARTSKKPMVFMISGDGGWTSFDQGLAETFALLEMPVIGLDAQKYFWKSKTPEETTREIERELYHQMEKWHKQSFMLVGYSFGASVVPFVANRFPESLKNCLAGINLLSPEEYGDFEIHVLDMLDLGQSIKTYNVVKETKKAAPLKPVCFFESEGSKMIKERFMEEGIKTVLIPGNHHFNDNFRLIVESIVKSRRG